MNKIYTIADKLRNDKNFVDLTDTNFGYPHFLLPETKLILQNSLDQYLRNRIYQPDSKGDKLARESIAYFYSEKGNITDPENIIITASTSESYNLIFQALTQQNDEVLIPNPVYPLFNYIISANHLSAKNYNLDINNNWQPDVKQIEASITSKTKFIFLVSPNNPTGSEISLTILEEIAQICAKNHIILIIDEVFSEFSDKFINYQELIAKYKTSLILLNGISKLLALPDLKLAWINCFNYSQSMKNKIELFNDMYLSANMFTQFALPALFSIQKKITNQINQQLLKNREIIIKSFANQEKYIFNKPTAGIHTFIGIKKKYTNFSSEDELIINLLKKHKILVHPGYFYDFEYPNTLCICLSYLHIHSTSALEQLNTFL